MLIHPIAENTLKFPSKFKHKIEEFKAQKFTLKPSELDLECTKEKGSVLAPNGTGFWLVWLQGFLHFSFAFALKKTEQPTPKSTQFWFPPFPSKFRPPCPKLGFQSFKSTSWLFLGNLVRLVARIEV